MLLRLLLRALLLELFVFFIKLLFFPSLADFFTGEITGGGKLDPDLADIFIGEIAGGGTFDAIVLN